MISSGNDSTDNPTDDPSTVDAERPSHPEPNAGSSGAAPDEPVTVVISRLVRPGMEAEYEAWIHDVAQLLADFDGAEGFTILPPGQHHSGPEYVLVLRFRDYNAMARWKRSAQRQRWIARLPELTVDTGAWQEQSGLETWFTLPGRVQPTGPPPRYKQALLTLAGLLPLLFLTDLVVRVAAPEVSGWLRIMVTTPIVVALMAWVVMPVITRLTYGWLYPGQR